MVLINIVVRLCRSYLYINILYTYVMRVSKKFGIFALYNIMRTFEIGFIFYIRFSSKLSSDRKNVSLFCLCHSIPSPAFVIGVYYRTVIYSRLDKTAVTSQIGLRKIWIQFRVVMEHEQISGGDWCGNVPARRQVDLFSASAKKPVDTNTILIVFGLFFSTSNEIKFSIKGVLKYLYINLHNVLTEIRRTIRNRTFFFFNTMRYVLCILKYPPTLTYV